MRQGRHGHAQLTGQLAEIEQLRPALSNRPGAIFNTRQRQQLVRQMCQPVGVFNRLFQRVTQDLRVMCAQAQFNAGLEHGQRGA